MAFLDASALIYQLAAEQPWPVMVRRQLRRLTAEVPPGGKPVELAFSRLSWLECRVGPIRRNDDQALMRFDAFFARPDLHRVDISPAVVEHATTLRARHNLQTPVALQAASCLQVGGDTPMICGNRGFARVPGLALLLVQSKDTPADSGSRVLGSPPHQQAAAGPGAWNRVQAQVLIRLQREAERFSRRTVSWRSSSSARGLPRHTRGARPKGR